MIATPAAVQRFWGDTRLVVCDTETVLNDGRLHVVSVGTVTCRAGVVRGKWQSLVNPGVPVDEGSHRIHGLTDDILADEPPFSEIASLVLDAFRPRGGEQVVFVAHNVPFDLTALRGDLADCGLHLPEMPYLDTMGPLAGLVDIRTKSGSLADLCDAVNVPRERSHDALYDAVLCAEAAVALLERAAARFTDIPQLLDHLGTTSISSVQALNAARLFARRDRRRLPEAHLAGHSELLAAEPSTAELDAWTAAVGECVKHRCPLLADRLRNAACPPAVVHARLTPVLAHTVDAGDAAGAATLIGAIAPLLGELPPKRGRLGTRNAVVGWVKHWHPKLSELGRCPDNDQCPGCRDRLACALDTWLDHAAVAALGEPEKTARGFLVTVGKEAGTGVYTTLVSQGVRALADAIVPLCIAHWDASGQPVRASQVANLAWNAGCRHADVVARHAATIASTSTATDLAAAVAICDDAIRAAGADTHDAWTRLTARRNHIAGLLARLEQRPSGRLDDDGNPIPVRRHHPAAPQRNRPRRFARTAAGP